MPTGSKLLARAEVSACFAPSLIKTEPFALCPAWAIHFFLPEALFLGRKRVWGMEQFSTRVRTSGAVPLAICTEIPSAAAFLAIPDLVLIPPLPNWERCEAQKEEKTMDD